MAKFSRSFLFPDVNVWVALTLDRHVHHGAARAWFESLEADESTLLCFCRITQLGFLRLLTTEAVMGEDEVLTQPEAWKAYDRWFDDPRTVFLDEPSSLEKAFRSLSRLPRPAAKDWADSYLAAFADEADLCMVTFDRALGEKSRTSILLS